MAHHLDQSVELILTCCVTWRGSIHFTSRFDLEDFLCTINGIEVDNQAIIFILEGCQPDFTYGIKILRSDPNLLIYGNSPNGTPRLISHVTYTIDFFRACDYRAANKIGRAVIGRSSALVLSVLLLKRAVKQDLEQCQKTDCCHKTSLDLPTSLRVIPLLREGVPRSQVIRSSDPNPAVVFKTRVQTQEFIRSRSKQILLLASNIVA